MNTIAIRSQNGFYDDASQVQFVQLIGYSVPGFSELSYVSDEAYERATRTK